MIAGGGVVTDVLVVEEEIEVEPCVLEVVELVIVALGFVFVCVPFTMK